MALLADALRQSSLAAAYMDMPDGDRVSVARTLAQPHPDAAERYVARIEHGAGLPQQICEAPTLDEVLARLRALNLSHFFPEGDSWMPTVSGTPAQSSEWSVDASSRGLSPADSAQGRHANDSDTLPPLD